MVLRPWRGVRPTHASRALHASHWQRQQWGPQRQHRARGSRGFFFSSPQSSSAWFLPWSAHSWTLNSFQLPNVGASATSDSESRAIVTATELVLSIKPGGLGTHNAEQLAQREWPRRLLFFILVCGEAVRAFYSALFQNSTGTFTLLQATVLLWRIIPLNTSVLYIVLYRQTWQPWQEEISIWMMAGSHSQDINSISE